MGPSLAPKHHNHYATWTKRRKMRNNVLKKSGTKKSNEIIFSLDPKANYFNNQYFFMCSTNNSNEDVFFKILTPPFDKLVVVTPFCFCETPGNF